MQIIIDSREQMPLDFVEARVGKPIVRKLNYGDYACEIGGVLVPVVFERKSVGDLFGTLGKGYGRFKREYLRAKKDGAKLILIVEDRLKGIACGYKHSRIPGSQILQQMFTLWVRHDIIPVFAGDRHQMARYIEETFLAIERNWT